MNPNDSHFWVFIPCVIHNPWVWTGAGDLPVTHKMWQSWQNVTFLIRLQKAVTLFLLTDSLSRWLWWWKPPFWTGPYVKELREACGQQPVKNWGPQSNSREELPATTEWVGNESCLSWKLIAAFWETLKQKSSSVSHVWIPNSRSCWIISCVLF